MTIKEIFTHSQILEYLRKVQKEEGGQREAAKKLDISPSLFCRIVAGRYSIEPVLKKLGLVAVFIKENEL